MFQLEEEEEEELEDKFEIFISVKDPEKIGKSFQFCINNVPGFILFSASRLLIGVCSVNIKQVKVTLKSFIFDNL